MNNYLFYNYVIIKIMKQRTLVKTIRNLNTLESINVRKLEKHFRLCGWVRIMLRRNGKMGLHRKYKSPEGDLQNVFPWTKRTATRLLQLQRKRKHVPRAVSCREQCSFEGVTRWRATTIWRAELTARAAYPQLLFRKRNRNGRVKFFKILYFSFS